MPFDELTMPLAKVSPTTINYYISNWLVENGYGLKKTHAAVSNTAGAFNATTSKSLPNMLGKSILAQLTSGTNRFINLNDSLPVFPGKTENSNEAHSGAYSGSGGVSLPTFPGKSVGTAVT